MILVCVCASVCAHMHMCVCGEDLTGPSEAGWNTFLEEEGLMLVHQLLLTLMPV